MVKKSSTNTHKHMMSPKDMMQSKGGMMSHKGAGVTKKTSNKKK
jgi:hypothetical protein